MKYESVLSKLKIQDFRGKARKSLDYYGTTEVTYEFTLTTSEENKQGASIDLLRKFSRRADTIGISLTEDRMRDVSRTFTLHDSFLFLATKIRDSDCAPEFGIDFIFPLRGQLPVEDLVNTYIAVNELGRLDVVKDATKSPPIEGSEKGPATRQMADTITFTTTLQINNSPNIKYNPDGVGFFTSGLTFTNENMRKDTHKVIVTLTTTDKPDGHGDFVSTVIPPDQKRKSGLDAVNSVRFKNLEDDVATIARSLQRNTSGL